MKLLIKIFNNLTIKKKSMTLLLAIGILFWITILLTFARLMHYSIDSQKIMTEYNNTSGFINAFTAENKALATYIRPSLREGVRDQYIERIHDTDVYLERLGANKERDSQDSFREKRSITNAMSYFRDTQEKMMNEQTETNIIKYYVSLQSQMTYIEIYAKNLMSIQMEEGDIRWSSIQNENGRAMKNIFFLLLVSSVVIIICIVVFDRTVLKPLADIGQAADEIYSGNYDAKPLPEGSNDEIGRTSRSFNLMQKEIRRTIDAIEKEAEMEKSLLEKEVETEQMKRKLEEGRFATLQSQINPHFLFNTLNTISALAHEEGGYLTEDLILRLSRFFRYSLESDEKMVTLGQEIRLLRDYEELQETRHGDRIVFEIDENTELRELYVPKFILQPLVENAIIHGLHEKSGTIRVKSCIYREKPTVFITDNGAGFDMNDPPEIKGHRSVGLQNVKARIEYAGGEMAVWSRKNIGTCIRITLGKGGENV